MEIYRNIKNIDRLTVGNMKECTFFTLKLVKSDGNYFWMRHEEQLSDIEYIKCRNRITGSDLKNEFGCFRLIFPFYEKDLD